MMDLDDVSTVNLPEQSGVYKVVQIQVDDKPFMRLRKAWANVYHKDILSKFLDENGISYDTFGEVPRPYPGGEGYKACGMGQADVDVDNKRIKLYGASVDYEIGIDRKHVDSINELVPDWEFFIPVKFSL